jgi:LacI family transcriptional regulator
MSTTIKDVARMAGLSIATVSKYLNGGHVLEANRQAIEQAIQRLDYRVNVIARGLKTRRTMTVGILIPSIEQVFSTEIIAAVEKRLAEAGFSTLVCDCQLDEALEEKKLGILLEKQVDGIIMMPFSGSATPLQRAAAQGVPVVLIDRRIEGVRTDCVLVDNTRLAFEATNRLIAAGHRRIGIVLGPKNLYTSRQRLEGYLAACQAHDIAVDLNLIRHSNYQIGGGCDEFRRLLELPVRPSAIFTTNYETTFAAGLVMNELDLAMPGDLSVIGFDGLSIAQIFRPCLTVAVQPVRNIGEAAAELLLDRMIGEPDLPPARERVLQGTLIEGGSVGTPPEFNH